MSNHSEQALWVTELTAALIFVGFKPHRFAGAGARDTRSDHPRGRLADKPSDIPTLGWKDILWRVYQNIGSDRVIALAAGVTFSCVVPCYCRACSSVRIVRRPHYHRGAFR
jgi:membrane protein